MPDISASAESYQGIEHRSHNESSDERPLSSADPEALINFTPALPVGLGESSSHLIGPSNTSSVSAEPSVTCGRCGKSNIAYELYMHCEQCNNGDYDLCLPCWRNGRGCLNWYGFGKSAIARWNREVDQLSDPAYSIPAYPHFLTGRRYCRITFDLSPSSDMDGPALVDTSKSKVELQSGFFCSNCSAFAKNTFWVCDICNDGEWAYCTFCVRAGRCCTHPLLPVDFSSPECAPSTSSITPQSIEKTQQVRPLKISVNCDICALSITPSAYRFHCPQCKEGDYDVCTVCYDHLVEACQISEQDGPRGWRRCLKGHRMIVARYKDSPRGQRYVIAKDLVGGHIITLADSDYDTYSIPPSGGVGLRVIALWSNWPEEGDDDELAFPKGAEIREYEKVNDDWSHGVYCGRKGLFPGNYGRKIDRKTPELRMKAEIVKFFQRLAESHRISRTEG